MASIVYIWLKRKPLKNTNSYKYHTLLICWSNQHQFLQKRHFYRNIPFIFYTKTYFLCNSCEAFLRIYYSSSYSYLY